MTNELKGVIRKYYEIEKAWTGSEKNSDEYLSSVCLFEYPSYRLLDSDKRDRLIGFRLLVRTLRRMLSSGNGKTAVNPEAKALVISSSKSANDIIQYISRSGKTTLHTYFDRDHMSLGDYGKWLPILTWLPLALRQAFRCIFSQYRSTIALTIAEIPEIALTLEFAKRNRISMLYDFLPYEVDSNFIYLVFRQNNIDVFKIPSSGPLATHHKILLSDFIAVSTPYHLEEMRKFRSTIRIGQFALWPPEKAHMYFHKYKSNRTWEETNTIGFYSHGEWIRKAEKQSDYGGRIGDAEEAILRMLGNLVRKNPLLKLRIFPHPRELKSDKRADMHAHYTKCIGHETFEVFTETGGTSQHFAKAEIAIAAFSTILYERLYSGYKTLIGNMFISEFPMNQSALNSICFKTEGELEAMLNRFGNLDADSFFAITGLANYRMDSYPEP
jgi:hypothetical protein